MGQLGFQVDVRDVATADRSGNYGQFGLKIPFADALVELLQQLLDAPALCTGL